MVNEGADVDVTDAGADVDVTDAGADVDVTGEGADWGVEAPALPHPTASKATSTSVASFWYVTICELNTSLCSDRARGPGRAQIRGWHGGRPVPIVAALRLFGLEVRVDRIRDRLISAPGLVLVDHRGPVAVAPHPGHQVPEPGAAFGMVPGVAEVAEVQARQADRLDRVRPGPEELKPVDR